MLGVQVGLVTVRTRILAIRVLLWYHAFGTGRTLRRRSWPTGRTRQDTAPSLRAHNVRGCLLVLHEGGLLTHRACAR